MVKLLFLCRRRADLSHEQYAERLLNSHVPIALTHHPTMRKYVVNIVKRIPPGMEPLDSIGELSFERLADFRERLYDSADGERVVRQDVAGFMGGAHAYAATEHVHKSQRAEPALGSRSREIKLFCPLIRRPGLSHAEFIAHWLDCHVPLALRHHPGLVRYVTDVVDERLSPTGEPWDGFAELYFGSHRDLATGMFDSPAGKRTVREDMARFIGRTGAYHVAEYVEKR